MTSERHARRQVDPATKRRRPPRRRRKIQPGLLIGLVFLFAVFAFLYAPMIITALFSFNGSQVQTWPMEGFTTQWYADLFDDEAMITAIFYSLKVALVAVIVSAVAGFIVRA